MKTPPPACDFAAEGRFIGPCVQNILLLADSLTIRATKRGWEAEARGEELPASGSDDKWRGTSARSLADALGDLDNTLRSWRHRALAELCQ